LNLGQLVSMMPETQAAETTLQTYRDSLITEGEAMAEAFQERVTKYFAAVQEGTMAPIKQQEEETALQEEQQRLQAYERQAVPNLVAAKRQELLRPVLARVEQAIDEIAAEEGFVMIFDTSQFNAVLFAADSEDVMPLIKEKLGIEE
jgi:outer membrane protein